MKKTTLTFFLLFFMMCWMPLSVWALEPPFDNTNGALKAIEVVEGKQIALWALNSSVSDRWFCRENNNDKKRSAILTDNCIFIVEASNNNDGIVLKRKMDNKYMKRGTGIEWTENKAEAVVLSVAHPEGNFNYNDAFLNSAPTWDPNYSGYLVRFTSKSGSDILNANDISGFATGIGSWSAFLVYDTQSGLKTEALEKFKTLLEQAKQYPLGNGLGQYTDSKGMLETLLKEVDGKEPETMDVGELEDLTAKLNEAIQNLTLNMPKTGCFYRLKNRWNKKYVSSVGVVNGDGTVAMVAEKEGKNTVYYLTEDYRLISSLVLAVERNYISSGKGGVFTIEAHPEILGTYTLSDLEHENSTLYALADHLDWAEYDYRENDHCAWILEEVTEQSEHPALVKEFDGMYTTLSAPVALNVPTGVEVYSISGIDSEKNELQTEKLMDKVIPAGSAVLLKRLDSQKNFIFTFANGGMAEEGLLVANYATMTVPTTENAYALASGEQGVCFYQLSETDRTLPSHSAYLVTSDFEVKVFYLDQEKTRIDEMILKNSRKVGYYDLQGRRVLKPTKGIYVDNQGQKVIFN